MFFNLVYSPFNGYAVIDAIPSIDFKVTGSLVAFLRLSVKGESCFLHCALYRRQLAQVRAHLCDSLYAGSITYDEFGELSCALRRLDRAYNEVF